MRGQSARHGGDDAARSSRVRSWRAPSAGRGPAAAVMFAAVVSATTITSLAGVTPADADPTSRVIACGQTITTSVKLATDLRNCPGDGLVIGASGITVDLNGHTISGRNILGSEGIADDGHGDVVIRNGVIRDFFVDGVGLRNARGSVVHDLAIRQIGAGGVNGQFSAGIALADSPTSRIDDNTVTNNVAAFEADGIVVKRSPGVRLVDNRLNQNSWDGLFVFASPHGRVEDNTADANPNNGMEVNGASDSTQILGNEATRNGNVGIAAGAMQHARIVGNTANANGFGTQADHAGLFLFDLNTSEIRENTADRNVVGIDLFGGLHGSTRNRIVGNTANRNATIGLLIDTGGDGTVANSAHGNIVIGNIANRNQGPIAVRGGGIDVFGTGNQLRANVADNNVADGVLIGTPGNALTDNTANRNAGHGIDGRVGTLDGGDNRAHDNRLPPQCVGVSCA